VRYPISDLLSPFLLQLGFFTRPWVTAVRLVPSQWPWLYVATQMVGVIDGFRGPCSVNTSALYWPGLFLSVALISVLLVTGLRHFRKWKTAADVI
jgi:ABC-type polysaccharide/polyol phosphate export permease